MIRWPLLCWPLLVVLAAAGCGGRNTESLSPTQLATPAAVDSLWRRAESAVRHADWNDALKLLPQLLVQLDPGDPRVPKARYYLGEAKLGHGDHLEAVREFRRVVDDLSDAPIAPDALLRVGDTYASMWRRPELDPTYGEYALAAYEELLTRFPGTTAAARARLQISDLNERFAYKALRSALYYVRIKAYDSAILYLRDLVATYPRTSVVPEALARLIEAYGKLGYQEDIQETCGYVRRYHPNDREIMERCRDVPQPAPSATAGS